MSQFFLTQLAEKIKQSHENKTGFKLPKMTMKDLKRLSEILE